jgi:hypothetical protein
MHPTQNRRKGALRSGSLESVDVTGPSTWQGLHARMERSTRSQAWRDAGCWALSSAEHHLGRDWLARHAGGQPVPAEFVDAGRDLEAFSHLLELGLRLELLKNVDGFGGVRRMLKRDLRPEAWRHPLVQLEVASLAQRAGLQCHLERGRSGPRGSPADVVFGPPDSEVVAEVKVVLLDDAAAAGGRDDHEVGQALNKLTLMHGVVFDGQMTARLGKEQGARWLARIEAAAKSVARTGRSQDVTWRGEVVTVLPMASAPDASFTGPVTYARGWERTRGLLADKAPQLAHHGGGWLRIDSLDGLFWASEWAHQPVPERTAAMEALVLDAVQRYPSIHGVVLTSAACWKPGMAKDSWRTPGGTYGLERLLPMGRGRATFIVPLGDDALRGIRRWHDLYDTEDGWLDWALSQVELPSIAEIMS